MELGALATRKLQEILRSYGIQKEPFKLPDVVLSGSEVPELFHLSGLLLRNDRIVFAYIRDNREKELHPKDMYKVHMSACKALKKMQEGARLSRYVITASMDDEREVDIVGGVMKFRLHPCQFCLEEVRYREFNWDTMTKRERKAIVREFRAKDVMPHLNERLEEFFLGQTETRG